MFKTIIRFFSPLKGLWGKSILRISTTILTNIITFIDIKLVANVVSAIEKKDIQSLHQNVYWLFLLLGATIVLNYIFPIFWNGIGTIMGNNIDKEFFQATTKLDNNRFERKGVGYWNSILRQGSNSRTFLLNQLTTGWTRYVVQFVGSFFLLFSINDQKIIWGGMIYYIIAVIMFIIYEKITIRYTKTRRNIGKVWSSFINRIIGSKFDVLQSNKRNLESDNFDKFTNQFVKIRFKQQFVSRLTRFPYLSAQFLRVVLYLYIGMQVINGQNSIAQLIFITSIMWQIVGGADGIVQIFIDIADNKVNIKELRSIKDEFPTIKGYADGNNFVLESGKIEFKDVVFAYLADEKKKDIEKISDEDEETKINKKEPVINCLNYIFEPGKKYAFVGPSGGGKSTIIKLIAGYLMADSGKILVDEQCLPNGTSSLDDEIQTISLSSYYPHIGYLTQEPMVFDGTIRDNLMYGIQQKATSHKPQADDLCRRALDLAHCDFVKDRETGLDTEIGEKGIKLSGGQRQRLAIARIFLKNPEIIILDEPTSALDSKSEDAVTKSMNDLFKGKTVFIIAHRLQTVKNADEILYIDGGKVVESGTHDQLIKQGGKYTELVTLQATF